MKHLLDKGGSEFCAELVNKICTFIGDLEEAQRIIEEKQDQIDRCESLLAINDVAYRCSFCWEITDSFDGIRCNCDQWVCAIDAITCPSCQDQVCPECKTDNSCTYCEL